MLPPPEDDENTIRILIATDSHVGYNERDPIRGKDSARSFEEVISLAKERNVDMILLSGDLFHDNKPSHTAFIDAMKTLRTNCLGDKPVELEILSDMSQEFQLAGGHVNYEDEDINVSIPVFSIHGNHDDPSGEDRVCALDILSVSGLVNYFGRTPENDNITISPVLLQKGHTKLAMYGLSNVRDERLFRTFRDGKVKFLRPDIQQDEWFNLMTVHQNHIGHSETGYLPENFLEDFLDVVIWGHEHECLIEPRLNTEMNFHVIQPGSSVATSLCAGEAVPKHCGILSITGRDFHLEKIRLKTVRPFVYKEIILAEQKEMKNVWRKPNNRTTITQFLSEMVEELIEEAKEEWLSLQEESSQELEVPLPLVRLRVEYSSPEGNFEMENPQRFSSRFVGKVANSHDVVQFHRKKTSYKRIKTDNMEIDDEKLLEKLDNDIQNITFKDLVGEFLEKATLEIIPVNGLSDAVGQFVNKDDKHATETFVDEARKACLTKMKEFDELDESKITDIVNAHKSYLEDQFSKGQLKIKKRNKKLKPKPDEWDSDIDGNWSDEPAAQIGPDDVASDDEDGSTSARTTAATSGRGRGRGRGARTTTTTRKPAATRKTPAKRAPAKGKKKAVDSDEEEEVDAMEIDDDDDEEEAPAPPPTRTIRKATVKKPAPKAATAGRQTQLNFAPSQRVTTESQATQALFHRNPIHISTDEEEIDDSGSDDFVPIKDTKGRSRR
ncbi:double-strand break repair protein mus-23 [Pyronema omphalodes]|nr:double-strand break repair protein mus-23 [Pyronema omphalodes]